MRTPLLRLAARLAPAALLAATALGTATPPAGAASIVYECRSSSVSCIAFSGYGGKSVWGYPVNKSGNNCTNYVAYRLARNGVPQQSALGNGGSWAANAKKRGFRVDRTPATGAIAHWNYGSVYAPSAGHVGYVEEVTASYIVISDSSWSGGSYRWRIPKGDRNWPSNFIHFKDTAYQPPKPGAFVKVRETGEVYRLVGKAPVYVSTWSAFGGSKPTHALSSASLASLPRYPADGTFIRGAQRRELYRIAGGAPVYVSTSSAFGGPQPSTTVDQVAIDNAGAAGRWNHLRAKPAEGTLLKGAQRGEIYRVAGGSPVYVSAWANIGGKAPSVTVDQVAIDKAGSGTKWNHLLHKPRDGAYLRGRTTGRIYYMKAGVAHHGSSWAQVGGVKPTTNVDQVAIDMAGTRTPVKWTHIADTGRL
jgi:surface antigen